MRKVMLLVGASVLFSASCGATVGEPVVARPTLVEADAPPDPADERRPGTVGPAARSPSVGPAPSPASEVPAPAFTLPIDPAPFPALVTETGVPVTVLGAADDELIVLTPCGRTTWIPDAGTPLLAVDVVLDPGHGGPIDTGAVGVNGLVERDLNLAVSRATADILAARGVTVGLTRTADYGVTLAVRSRLADVLEAEAMVSVHHNAPTPAPSAGPGVEVFVQSGSDASSRLGGLVWQEVFDALERFDEVAWVAAEDAGVLAVVNSDGTDAYGMIRRPVTPTVLAELAYLSNPAEARLLATPRYVFTAAVALADAIETYLDQPSATGRGHVAAPRVFDPDRAPGTDQCEDPVLTRRAE